MFRSRFFYQRDIGKIKTTESSHTALFDSRNIPHNVADNYIAVDICKKDIGRLAIRQCRRIPENHIDITVATVCLDIFAGIYRRHLVNFYG